MPQSHAIFAYRNETSQFFIGSELVEDDDTDQTNREKFFSTFFSCFAPAIQSVSFFSCISLTTASPRIEAIRHGTTRTNAPPTLPLPLNLIATSSENDMASFTSTLIVGMAFNY
ncbi:hypothetical protein EMCRGX_G014368 [Ephydatia muelleri]